MKSAVSTQKGKKYARQERVSDLVLAAPYSPEESSFQAEKFESKKSQAAETKSPLHCARKARKKANLQKEEFDQNSSDDGSREYKKEAEPGAYSIARTQMENHPAVEESPATINGSNRVDDDVKVRAMVVEADLVPELTSAEEVNIQEEEAVIAKKVQYRRALRVTMAWDGLAVICNIIGFVFLFVKPYQDFFWSFIFRPFWFGLLPSACCFFIATLIILRETMRCCTSSLTVEQYAPDDKALLRDTHIAIVASLCLFFVATPIIIKLPDLQWLGYMFMTWYFAGTVFTFFNVQLLRRSKETRQKKSKCFWIFFGTIFLGLSGATIWRCLSSIRDCGEDCQPFLSDYPNCTVTCTYCIGNGYCDGGSYNTIECGFDGGDCQKDGEFCSGDGECASHFCNFTTKVCGSNFFAEHYPDCYVDHPDWIGDGECDDGNYAKEACGFDGGDCLELDEPCLQDKDCASKFCNVETKVCYLGILEKYPDCVVEYPRKIGDGNCDGRTYATKACGYDGGDCSPPSPPSSTVLPSFHITVFVAVLLSFQMFFT